MPVSRKVCRKGSACPAALAVAFEATCLGDVGQERAKERHGRNDRRADCDALVMALVVLPTASRSAMIWRAFLSSRHLADTVGVVPEGI